MKLKIFYFSILVILFTSCDLTSDNIISDNNVILPINTNCPDGEIMGCDDNCSATPIENDACGICGGEITNLSECSLIQCTSDVCISIQNVNLNSNKLEVWMLNNIPVAGFQFSISGIVNISASGGSAQSNGMSPSIGENLILGFSFSGNAIPPGNGMLTQLNFSEISGSICLSLPVFSNNSGESLSIELGECF